MKSIKTDEFENLSHDAFLEAYNSNHNLADNGSLDIYIEIINNHFDTHRSEFNMPPRSYFISVLEKHADKIFISGQDFSEWSSNFCNFLEE